MNAITCKVRRAPKDVQDAPIDRGATQLAQRPVHLLRVSSHKIINALQAEVAKGLADTRSDAGNHLELTGRLVFRFHVREPLARGGSGQINRSTR